MRKDIAKDGEKTQFEAGKSGNPNGRPKGVPNTATRLQKFLNAKMRGKHPTTGEEMEFTVAEAMDLQQIAKALKGDTAAWEKILDRMEGKSVQRNENLNLEVATGEMRTYSPEQIDEIEKILANGRSDKGIQSSAVPGKQKGRG